MATERQFQIPGGPFINEATNDSEYQIPGAQYVNEDTQSSVLSTETRTIVMNRQY